MVKLREIHLPDQPYFGREQELPNEHAEALLSLEKRMGVQCWEVVPDETVQTLKPADATDTERPTGKKSQ